MAEGNHILPESPSPAPPVLCLAGATATGKSQIALRLAEELRGEIISVDSMQVYRGLDIGTAKPSPEDRNRVPHHLIDAAGLDESFDAARFVRLAGDAVAQINSRGHLPIFCGGTGLYFKAYLEGLGHAPQADHVLRAEIESTPIEDLLRELEQRDAAAFQTIDRKNSRRVVRAIEVIRLTGKPFSVQRATWASASETTSQSAVFFALARESADLHSRITARVELMFRRGLVPEVRELLSRGLAENKTAMQAIGYRQVVEYLHGGHTLAETIEQVKIRTRQFAKRQMTWLRRHAAANWIHCGAAETPDGTAKRILSAWRARSF